VTENHRPTFFYRAFQIFAYVGALPFIINTLDVLLNPTATPLDGTMASRLVTGLIIAPVSLVIGILCTRRAPDNLIGWMLITFGYGASSLVMRLDLLPLTPTLMIANLFVTFFWISYLLIPLYFPNGRLYPPRLNRWGNLLLNVLIALMFLAPILLNKTIAWGTGVRQLSVSNPFFVAEFDFTVITVPLMIGILIFGAITLFLRYRAGSTLERLQLRWLLAGVMAQFGVLFLSTGLAEVLNVEATLVGSLYTVIIPIAIGIAILRHKLYDIDIIIRRTLIYSALTTILAMIYFGAIILTQQLFRAATGETPDIAIVVSTLLIAALFSPIRRRVQDVIDRRLYRRKYDVEKTLAQFQHNLRDEVDMETLKSNLVGVVNDTMQPDKIALWIPDPVQKAKSS
jgi:hypothetical protein